MHLRSAGPNLTAGLPIRPRQRGAHRVRDVVTDLLRDADGRVIGVKTDREDGDLRARVVLLADWVNSPLAKKMDLAWKLSPAMWRLR